MDSFIYTCYYLLPPFLKQTSVMTKCLLLMQPAGGSIAARKSHPPFPFICPSPTPLSLPSLSLMVYHFLCIFPASYSPNPPQSLTLLCVYLHKCVQCARLPGGHSCAAVAGGRGIPEPIHRGMTQTDLSKKKPTDAQINPQIQSALHARLLYESRTSRCPWNKNVLKTKNSMFNSHIIYFLSAFSYRPAIQ